MTELVLVVLTFFLSIIFSIIGIGGASIYIPLLYFFGYEIKQAIITALLLNIVSSFTSLSTQYKAHKPSVAESKHVLLILIGIIIGGALGSKLFYLFDHGQIKILFAAFLIFLAYNLYRDKINYKIKGRKITNISKKEKFLVGTIIGLTAALFGIGGGILLVPFFLYKNIELKKATFFSHLCVFFSSIYAFILNFSYLGKIEDMLNLFLLALVVVIGSKIGSKNLIEKKIEDKTIRKVLAGVMLIFGIKIFLDGMRILNIF
ncbi:MAG: sulfite exporter TauE/SafE family protein [Candidatus Anstonellaceae archaeon]